jgi:hypothetical protein
MEKVFMIAVIVTILFLASKVFEMKYIDKEWKPMKFIVRDAISVFACTALGAFLYLHLDGSVVDFLNVVTNNKTFDMGQTQVFTDEPGF